MPFRRNKSLAESTSTRAIILIILLSMALMRIVWMQFRSYPISSNLRSSTTVKMVINNSDSCSIVKKDEYKPIELASPEFVASSNWLVSPGYSLLIDDSCKKGFLNIDALLEWNQIFTVLASVFIAFLVRFLTSSWLFAVIIALSLLSRGELLIRHGQITYDGLLMFLITCWFTFAAHFLRTAASVSLLGMIVCFFGGILVDRSFIALGLGFTFFVAFSLTYRRGIAFSPQVESSASSTTNKNQEDKKSRTSFVALLASLARSLNSRAFRDSRGIGKITKFDAGRVFSRGSAFKTLDAPFTIWCFQNRRWLKLILGWLALTILAGSTHLIAEWQMFQLGTVENYFTLKKIALLQLGEVSSAYFPEWFKLQFEFSDIFAYLSMAMIVLSLCLKSHFELIHVKEFLGLFFVTFILLLILSFLSDTLYTNLFFSISQQAAQSNSNYEIFSQVLYWIEPVLLSLGAVSLLNTLKSFYLNGVR